MVSFEQNDLNLTESVPKILEIILDFGQGFYKVTEIYN